MYRYCIKIARAMGVLMVALGLAMPACAQDDGRDHAVVIERFTQHFVVQGDGGFVEQVEWIVRVDQERAIETVAQQALSYNHSLETLAVNEAFTQKPDGRKVMVQASQIREQQESASAGAAVFQDSRLKTVIFPQVVVGDRLVLRFERRRTRALFPRHFEAMSVPPFNPVVAFSITYDLPADMPLHVDNRGFQASPLRSGSGRTVYRWDYVPTGELKFEVGAVDYPDHGHRLAVSTLKSHAQLAAAYRDRARVEVTPAIAALAQQLTAGLSGERDKALVLGDWVRQNIRYVAVYVGAGGVVPHAAQQVLDNRYGDCKDQVALLEALLQAVSIASSPALVNMGSAYRLPEVGTLGVLNHAIVYIPSLDLYLDPADASLAAGHLSPLILDKPTVLTDSGTLGRTPALQFGTEDSQVRFQVADDGSAQFNGTFMAQGWISDLNHSVVGAMRQAQRDQLVRQAIGELGRRGHGTLSLSAATAPEPYRSRFEGHVEDLLSLPGPTGVPALSSLFSGMYSEFGALAVERERALDFVCLINPRVEQARFEFPAKVTVLALPAPVQIRDAYFDYQASYTREGNAVVVQRRMQFKHPRAVCSPEDFKVMKPALDAVLRDLQSQIIVTKG